MAAFLVGCLMSDGGDDDDAAGFPGLGRSVGCRLSCTSASFTLKGQEINDFKPEKHQTHSLGAVKEFNVIKPPL